MGFSSVPPRGASVHPYHCTNATALELGSHRAGQVSSHQKSFWPTLPSQKWEANKGAVLLYCSFVIPVLFSQKKSTAPKTYFNTRPLYGRCGRAQLLRSSRKEVSLRQSDIETGECILDCTCSRRGKGWINGRELMNYKLDIRSGSNILLCNLALGISSMIHGIKTFLS